MGGEEGTGSSGMGREVEDDPGSATTGKTGGRGASVVTWMGDGYSGLVVPANGGDTGGEGGAGG